MDKKLLKDAISKIVSGIVLLGLLLFLPAGTLAWKNGWLFMALLFIPMLIAGLTVLLTSASAGVRSMQSTIAHSA